MSYCLTARRVLFLPPWPEDFPPARGNTKIPASTSTQSSTTCTGWKIWEPHIRCQLLQISLRTSDEVSPKCSKLTTRPKRCENMLCFDWTLASFTAKKHWNSTRFWDSVHPLLCECCDWASCTDLFFLLFYFFQFKREVKRKGTHLPPGSHMWLKSRLEWIIAIRIDWRHCPLTLCCLPGGLPWTSATSATLSKAQTSAAAQGKTAHLIGRAFES